LFHLAAGPWRNPLHVLDMTNFMTMNMVMKIANVADFKSRISEFLAAVEAGEEIEVRKRNVPVARVVPVEKRKTNGTVLGCGRGTGRILGDVTEPLIPAEDWDMLGRGRT